MASKTFRPPQAVRDAALKGIKFLSKWERGDSSSDKNGLYAILEKGEPIPLGKIQRMNSFFDSHPGKYEPNIQKNDGGPTEGTIDWLLCGGLPGRRWARRILRQEGLIKAQKGGDINLPAFIDLQLGPQLYMGVVEKSCQEVADSLIHNGVRGAVAPYDEETSIIFFAMGDEDDTRIDDLEKVALPVEVALNEVIAIEESRTKARTLAKSAGDDLVGFNCYAIDSDSFEDMDFSQLYLLEAVNPSPVNILKVDTELGLVFGWAIISKIDGVDYFDTQDDHIPEESMLEGALDFMSGERIQGDMHLSDEDGIVKRGQIVFAWPLTEEIAQAFDIDTKQTGLMIAAKPDPDVLEKFADGTYQGFSIGGRRIPEHTEEVEG